MPKLPESFYTRKNVVKISRELLGKVLCTCIDGQLTEAVIVETEAYAGVKDKASHACGGRRTKRTEVMFWQGGHAYIYLCYGMYSLFNVVTHTEGTPHAVLIRGAVPLTGIDTMLQRAEKQKVDKNLLIGPGKLAKALGLHFSLTGTSLSGDLIWIEDRGISVPTKTITATPRIGVDYAGEDALLPYRFITEIKL
ncbi:MAG: DNA-3-methyladenine glycosylase [Bacteroidales bacterium]|nr:DNA-3-methyladenine glycosylase [Bacteroidales bacterium]MCL2133816.1 DNA-3-methyladenine glycosylase [Bacteroidales bacterium]